ncbi:MAG: hypothetical protein A2481_04150 [Candidatus Yonathbacteria bacterium RIFOXYC2_FULL_47_9]|nr:MAG: hypothetical protein A2481_04150 [Candidatus Yonathbacteria bacterium RIFOXYC2_FULL_47_9]HAT68185.1 hypothetical protein [Candidatus Yonathbacteria bacterium]
MNKFLSIGKYLFTTLCVIFLTTGNSYAGWHELTQIERDQRILIQARLYYDGQYLGNPAGECKIWVAEVVRRAAALEGTDLTLGGTQQALPLTQGSPVDYLWYPRSDVSGVSRGFSVFPDTWANHSDEGLVQAGPLNWPGSAYANRDE